MPVGVFPGFSSNAIWGAISGDINDQADLQAELNGTIVEFGSGAAVIKADATAETVVIGDVNGVDTSAYLKVDVGGSTVEAINAVFTANQFAVGTDGIVPITEGVGAIGKVADPFASLCLGTDSTKNTTITSDATGVRTATLPDISGAIVIVNGLTLPVTIGVNGSGGVGKRALVVDNA